MSNKNFSIIVPYYNSNLEQTKCCLSSLILQNFSLLKEIIVVNDGSNEKNKNNLIAIVNDLNTHTHTHACTSIDRNDEIKKHNPLIRIIHQENLGLAKARYTGVKNSTGDIILFVDSDDWICDNKLLDKLNKYFEAYKNIEVIKYNYTTTFINDAKQINMQKAKIKKCVIDINWYLNKNRTKCPPVAVWNYAYKKSVLMDPIFWETSFKLPFEDVYFNSYLLNKKLNAIVTNEIFYCYRINNFNSILFKCKKITLINRIKIMNKWFISSSNWNIFISLECKEYWISIYLRIILSHGSFREIINQANENNLNCPTIEEFKAFLKKYKFRNFFIRVYIKLSLNSRFFDYKIRKIVKKIFNIIYKIKNKLHKPC